jgi:hypothetical protein
MAVGAHPAAARAVAAFNPTAPEPGFLQPLLVGLDGDNRTFVQVFSSPNRIASFEEVAWPDRDFLRLAAEPVLQLGGEPLWGFLFPDEVPLAEPWSVFRMIMQERIAHPSFARRPLLLFDIVDTLELEAAKPEIFTRAFRAYAEMGTEAATRWRDRAILEPALARILPQLGLPPHRTTTVDPPIGERTLPRLRARAGDDQVVVTLEGGLGERENQALQQEYDRLAEQFPAIFPRGRAVVAMPPPRRAGPPPPKEGGVTVVLVGRLDQGNLFREDWVAKDIEVISADRFHPALRVRSRVPAVTILLGTQSDWPQLTEVAMRMGDHPTFIVFLSASAAPLLRDLDHQATTALPTVAFFAPYATSTTVGRDPVASIRPILAMLQDELSTQREFSSTRFFPALHNLVLREPAWAEQDPVELVCRLGARAIKAGAVLGGGARLYRQGALTGTDPGFWRWSLSRLFDLDQDDHDEPISARRAGLLLLVERTAQYDPDEQRTRTPDAIRRLFELRGWDVGAGQDRSFDVETRQVSTGFDAPDTQRRFHVLVVDHLREVPAEDPAALAPGLARAPLLVIHTQARRDALLVGNRGQFFHAAVEDIALMAPGTPWVWAVLRRQLFDAKIRLSPSALRLCTTLLLEAIRADRVSPEAAIIGLSRSMLNGPDWDRFVRLIEPRPRNGRITLAVTASEPLPSGEKQIVVDLLINDDGPYVEGSDVRFLS